jgi:hypothetical protein
VLLQQRETILLVMRQMNPVVQMSQPQKLWVSEEDEDVRAIEDATALDTEEKALDALNLYLEQMGLEGNVETYEG